MLPELAAGGSGILGFWDTRAAWRVRFRYRQMTVKFIDTAILVLLVSLVPLPCGGGRKHPSRSRCPSFLVVATDSPGRSMCCGGAGGRQARPQSWDRTGPIPPSHPCRKVDDSQSEPTKKLAIIQGARPFSSHFQHCHCVVCTPLASPPSL
jgi:hypothetical protein